MTDRQLANYLIKAGGDILTASVLAGISAATFSARLKRSEVIQFAQAEVGAIGLEVEPTELINAVRLKEPWAIMYWLDSAKRFSGARARGYNRDQLLGMQEAFDALDNHDPG